MTNQIATISAEINTLEAEGFALAKEWKAISKADKARFTKSTKADGFDTRLGKLMFALKQEANGRITSQRLKDCGINIIDKRRRSEALWFVENESDARQFVQASKKGFTSLTALQAAMRKAEKASEPKADASPVEPEAETPVEPEADAKSNVGLTASDIALEVMVQVELLANANSISTELAFKEVMLAIKEAATMADKVAA